NWTFPGRGIEPKEPIADYFMSKGNFLMTSSFAMDSFIARNIMFDEEVKKFQDFDFLLRAEQAKFFIAVDLRPGYVYHDEHQEGRLSRGDLYGEHLVWIMKNPYLSDRGMNCPEFRRHLRVRFSAASRTRRATAFRF